MLIVVGAVLVLISNRMTKQRIKGAFGQISDSTVKMSEGTGVVPKWVSLIGLAGYVFMVLGVISLFV
jgi:hypothetical protein